MCNIHYTCKDLTVYFYWKRFFFINKVSIYNNCNIGFFAWDVGVGCWHLRSSNGSRLSGNTVWMSTFDAAWREFQKTPNSLSPMCNRVFREVLSWSFQPFHSIGFTAFSQWIHFLVYFRECLQKKETNKCKCTICMWIPFRLFMSYLQIVYSFYDVVR